MTEMVRELDMEELLFVSGGQDSGKEEEASNGGSDPVITEDTKNKGDEENGGGALEVEAGSGDFVITCCTGGIWKLIGIEVELGTIRGNLGEIFEELFDKPAY